MKIDIITIFPEMFAGPFNTSMIKKAQEKKLVEINIHNLRDWAKDKHKTVDDNPYGGGPGMIMMIEPIEKALAELKTKNNQTVLLSAKGKLFSQERAQQLSVYKHLILLCGHYEDVDQRVVDNLIDEEISIGNYVLTGGEIPAMVVADSVARLIPGVLGADEGLKEESHSTPGYIEYPQYTRPDNYKGWKVPDVLLSGNHAEINKWRKEMSKNKK